MLALLPLALSLAPELAKWIAGDTAGAVAQKAAEVVQAVTGTDDPASATAALADPVKAADLRIRLAEIAAQREAAADQARLDTLRAGLADVSGARTQTTTLAQAGSSIAWAAPVVSVVIVAGFFACVVLLFAVERTWDERAANLLNVLFGALIPGFAQVCNYWLGSSAGSKASGDAVRAIAAGAASGAPAAIATTAGVKVNNPPQPSSPGTTADDLNERQLRAIKGEAR